MKTFTTCTRCSINLFMLINMLSQYLKRTTKETFYSVLFITTLRPTVSYTKDNLTRDIFRIVWQRNIGTTISNAAFTLIWHVKQTTRIDEQYNLTVSSRISIRTNTILYLRLSSQNFDLPKSVSWGHSLTLVQKRKIRLKWDDLNAQLTLSTTTKWLQTEIFATMAGAASDAIASSSKLANENSERTIPLSILSILAN